MPSDPVRGFSLSDFDGPNQPADNLPADTAAPAAAPVQQTPSPAPPTPEPEEPETPPEPTKPEPAATPAKTDDEEEDDSPSTISDAMDRKVEEAKIEAEDRAEAERKAKDAPADKPKDEPDAEKAQRDADLEKIQVAPQTHPKSKRVINEIKGIVRTTRDERDSAMRERDDLRVKLAAAEEKGKNVSIPKELEAEVKTLRERVRELDITKDPEIASKYDGPIGENSKAIGAILKTWQLSDKGIQDVISRGATLETVYAHASQLRRYAQQQTAKAAAAETPAADKPALLAEAEQAEMHADELIHLGRQNNQIAKQKQTEIDQWKTGYDTRVKQRELQTKQQFDERQRAIATHRDSILGKDMEVLQKDMPFLKAPPSPSPNDQPAVVKAKQTAIDEFAASQARVDAQLKTLNMDNLPPEKVPEAAGNITAHAVQAVILKQQAIPQLLKQQAALTARVRELEAELNKRNVAGKLSRAQGGSGNDSPNRGQPEPRNLEEAFDQVAGPGAR